MTKYNSIVVFLIIEILALVSFMFGNGSSVLYFLGSLISIGGFVFAFINSNSRQDFIKLLPILAVLVVISGITAFGPFGKLYGGISFQNVAVFLAIPAFFSLGFVVRRLADIKIKHILLAIGGGLGLLTLLSIFATWINYGLFYSLVYKIKDTTLYYYNGAAFDITKEMYFLVGLKFVEVPLSYGGLFMVLCGSFLTALLFLKPRENKVEFIVSASIGGIGLISLLTIPYFEGLIVLGIVYVFALIYRFLFKNKVANKVISISVGVILLLGVLFYSLALLNAATGFKFGGILNRVLVDNGKMKNTTEVLRFAFSKNYQGGSLNLFGFNMFDETFGFMATQAEILKLDIGYFEVELIKEVGPIVSLLFIVLLCAMAYFLYKYLNNNSDHDGIKVIIVSLIVGYFLYQTLFNTIAPRVHDKSYFGAFLRSEPFMIILFILGLIYYAPNKVKEESQNE